MPKKRQTDTPPVPPPEPTPDTDRIPPPAPIPPDTNHRSATEKRPPVYKVGPIVCDRSTTVEALSEEGRISTRSI